MQDVPSNREEEWIQGTDFEERQSKPENLSIEEMITRYGNDVLRTAYLYVKDINQAEDIFQDVFVKVSQRMDQFEGRSSIKTWLIRITINACKDFLKSAWKQRVSTVEEQVDEPYHDQSFSEIERKEDQKIIYDAVMELPIKYREVIVCVYYKELTMSETADVLHISEGTVKSRLSRAKSKMKKILEGRHLDYEY